jgi:hypothetical protein
MTVQTDVAAAPAVEQISAPAPEAGKQTPTAATPEPSTPENAQDAAPTPKGEQLERDEKGRYKGVQPRIDELTRKRYEAEREAAYWKGVATQGKPPADPAQAAQPAAKPAVESFPTYGEYVEALAEWKADQKISQALSQREQQAATKQAAETWETRQAAFRQVAADYDQVVGSADEPVSAAVADALRDSAAGPAIAYHLAKNPDLLDRLNGLPARSVDREIGRLEERLSASAPAAKAAVSSAPAPAKTTSGAGRASAPTLANSSMEEYKALRKAQGARWAR